MSPLHLQGKTEKQGLGGLEKKLLRIKEVKSIKKC
jgi:hypothetical protein